MNKICKDGASTKSKNDGVCELEEKLQNMSTADDKEDNNVSVCANCGKEGDDVNNICNKCNHVKYCNATCKKKHRSKHKKQCERRVAELHDEKLFRQPPPLDDCPICFTRIPTLETGSQYMVCCGKVICSGCIHAPLYDHQGNEVDNEKCPFCRAPFPESDKETNSMLIKRVEVNDDKAINTLGCFYRDGVYGIQQNDTKALGFWHRAGGLGLSTAHCSIGYAYEFGRGVEVDKNKARHYYELSALSGNVVARHNLGHNEMKAGNIDRALKHHIIAVRGGYSQSLEKIKEMYTNGHATKEDYTEALHTYQKYLGEIKSVQRDKAAANYQCRYY